MLPFLANFGIGKNATNFNTTDIVNENPNRSFRLSSLDPMNSNIAFVMYACPAANNQTNSVNDTTINYKIKAFHNENLIKLEACKTTECSLEEIQAYLKTLISKCVSSEQVCSLN